VVQYVDYLLTSKKLMCQRKDVYSHWTTVQNKPSNKNRRRN